MRKIRPVSVDFKWVFLMLIFKTGFLYSQVSDNSLPVSFNIITKNAEVIPDRMLDSVLVESRVEEDKRLGIPNRYGVIQEININIREEGLKTVIGDISVWRYEISCPDALSLGVYFSTFYLPDGADVYVYSSDKTKVRGGFTSTNNKDGNQLAIAETSGNSVIIEYDEPPGVEFPGELVIGYVSKAYRNLKSAAATRIGINCPEGSDWQDDKRAVCLMTFVDAPYSYYCTGFLVNNVREDGTPYFMTANHCISTSKVAGTLVTYFNYENSTCLSSDASMKQSLSGATLKATSSYSDFTLLELSETPPDAYIPFFAGWDASDTDAPTKGTCIHHPQGSYKCIALDYEAPVTYANSIQWDNKNTSSPNTHWKIVYDDGKDESGSSGSPLFDQNKRIIGQLHGGDDTSSFFGKFNLSWDYNSSSSAQLKNWLDPDNTNTLRLDGNDFRSAPVADFTVDVSKACLKTTVYLTDKSKYVPSEWLWKIEPATFQFVNGTTENSQNPQIMFSAEGYYSITLIAGNANGKDTVRHENIVDALAKFNVTFSGFPKQVTLCGSKLKNYQMVAEGANTYNFNVSDTDKVDESISSNVLTLTLKDAARKYGSFDMVVKVTGSHGVCSSTDSVVFHVVMQVNDNIANAIALKLGENGTYSNECGTVEANEPFPPSSGCLLAGNWCPTTNASVLDNSVWFTFPGTSTGKITVETSGFDTQLAVYEADSYSSVLSGNYTLVGAGDNTSSGTAAVAEDIPVKFNKTYWLQIDGNNGAYGDMTINLISNTIEVYPNPSSGVFHVTVATKDQGNVEIEIFSVAGECIYSNSVPLGYDNNTITLDLSGHGSGIYYFRASINGLKMTKKLMLIR